MGIKSGNLLIIDKEIMIGVKWHEILDVVGSIVTILGGVGLLVAAYHAVQKRIKRFIWLPPKPLVNNVVKDIKEYPMDFLFDIESGSISGNSNNPSSMATGRIALIQNITKSVLTRHGEYDIYTEKYGVEEAESIFVVKDSTEFLRQAANLSKTLMASYSDWIQELYSISRKKDGLFIEIKVKGESETIVCHVPNINRHSSKSRGNKRQ